MADTIYTKTEKQVRKEFAIYFLDLKQSMADEGGKVSKSNEWEFFIQNMIDDGDVPAEAINWKCPRSLWNLN